MTNQSDLVTIICVISGQQYVEWAIWISYGNWYLARLQRFPKRTTGIDGSDEFHGIDRVILEGELVLDMCTK